jgi:hypothetical protein
MQKTVFFIFVALLVGAAGEVFSFSLQDAQKAMGAINEDGVYVLLQEYADKVQGQEKVYFIQLLDLHEQELVTKLDNFLVNNVGKLWVLLVISTPLRILIEDNVSLAKFARWLVDKKWVDVSGYETSKTFSLPARKILLDSIHRSGGNVATRPDLVSAEINAADSQFDAFRDSLYGKFNLIATGLFFINFSLALVGGVAYHESLSYQQQLERIRFLKDSAG